MLYRCRCTYMVLAEIFYFIWIPISYDHWSKFINREKNNCRKALLRHVFVYYYKIHFRWHIKYFFYNIYQVCSSKLNYIFHIIHNMIYILLFEKNYPLNNVQLLSINKCKQTNLIISLFKFIILILFTTCRQPLKII